VHPNVPVPNQSRLSLFWRRLKMMLIAVMAPELMVGFAARQFLAAWVLSKGRSASSQLYGNLTFISSTEFDFSMTHGFLFCMGGFVSSTGYPVVTKKQLADPELGSEFLASIKNVDAEAIMDKSKGDALFKGLALAQGLWFTTQCLARVHQHLAVTELEVATLAFAVVNIFIWLLWWDKPLDVQWQIVIGSAKTADAQPINPVRVPRLDRIQSAIIGIPDDYEYNLLLSASVSSFWSLPAKELDNTQDKILPLAIEALVGTVFGAIHCAAWNTDFPTTAETWLWRSCSSIIVAIPVTVVLCTVLLGLTGADESSRAGKAMLGIGFFMPIPIYVIARLILIILPLVGLRSLSTGALANVNWSVYIPHL
jgi:hypothetical protein